jgi:hypothetical protein
MRNKFRATIVVILSFCIIAQGAQNAPSYNGKWWLSVTKQQRLGFVEGYAVCYSYDTDGTVKFTESRYAYEPRLTEYLSKNRNEDDEPIEDLLLKIAVPPYARTVAPAPGQPEIAKGKYGYLDGDYWRQNVDTHRLGLVQGFLYCYSRHARVKRGTFSKPASAYLEAISKWYGVKADDPSEINLQRMNAKIPDVLFRFRDGEAY